jgi:adenylate kinase family enzyme
MPADVGPLIVLGLPCAGKTTLAAGLASALGYRHLSVGELIRSAREREPDFRLRSEAAYLGREDFPPDDLARLISAWLAGNRTHPDHLVLDAGPPIDRVGQRLGWCGIGTLVVVVDEATALARLRQRQRSAGRVDDVVDVFHERVSRFRQRLPEVVHGLSRLGWTASVSGATGPRGVLRQALSAVEFQTALRRRPQTPVREVRTDYLLDAVSTLDRAVAAGNGPVDVAVGDREPDAPGTNAMVLLCKPRVRLAPDALHRVDVAAHRFGYRTTRMSAWSGTTVAETSAAAAHFDLHAQVSRWGSRLADALDADLAESVASGATVLGGHEFLAAYGPDALARAWQEESSNPPRPVGGRFWSLVPPDVADVVLLNGHMPAVLADYERPDSTVYALLLRASGSVAPDPWSVMRTDFLGHTDPARAAADSLRSRAVPGDLLRDGRGSFRNNGFHLSRGPLEAIREAGIWFGSEVLADVARRAYASPPGLDPSALAVDWPTDSTAPPRWAFEITATQDAGSTTVSDLVNRRRQLESAWRGRDR